MHWLFIVFLKLQFASGCCGFAPIDTDAELHLAINHAIIRAMHHATIATLMEKPTHDGLGPLALKYLAVTLGHAATMPGVNVKRPTSPGIVVSPKIDPM